MDAVNQILDRIERTGSEGDERYAALTRKLQAAWRESAPAQKAALKPPGAGGG